MKKLDSLGIVVETEGIVNALLRAQHRDLEVLFADQIAERRIYSPENQLLSSEFTTLSIAALGQKNGGEGVVLYIHTAHPFTKTENLEVVFRRGILPYEGKNWGVIDKEDFSHLLALAGSRGVHMVSLDQLKDWRSDEYSLKRAANHPLLAASLGESYRVLPYLDTLRNAGFEGIEIDNPFSDINSGIGPAFLYLKIGPQYFNLVSPQTTHLRMLGRKTQ